MSEAFSYTVNRWECPACGEVHESDADFDPEETCGACGEVVSVRG